MQLFASRSVGRDFSLSLLAPPFLPRHEERRGRTAQRARLRALRPPLVASGGGAGSGVRAAGWDPGGQFGRQRSTARALRLLEERGTGLRTSAHSGRAQLGECERVRAPGALATAPLGPDANQPLPPPLAAGGQSIF
ncbi:hypothetical protein mRhiFer1_008153 [Rhinolophus ferrumequinum]|uniref:Uncharacterized protein n=1 Tax=Rhinolophus ferrumequinum TaxID=59479 RepID=A0A7J7W7X2_RHIFE|nr:hypothetical protein mRhiFer1_008153 [Rhinolophus ferrumequinum]